MEEKDENVVEETTQKNQQDPGDENVVKVDESKFESAGNDNVLKVDLSKPPTPKQEKNEEPKENTEVETSSTDDSGVVAESENADTPQEQEKVQQEAEAQEAPVLEEITEESTEEEITEVEQQVEEAVAEAEATGKPIPENLQKLMDFMEETGGDLNDYVKLNQDYSGLEDKDLLYEYYKQTKPHLDNEEINFLMEDQFSYDEEEDDEREIKRKKLALKEQVANAKSHLDGQKSKYYEEIKAGSKLTPEQQKAMDFFNRYNKESEETKKQAEAQKSNFLNKTNQVFNDKFKGFEYNVGDKKYRFKVNNASEVKEAQSDINNFVKKFLNEKNEMSDAKGYHKSLYTAMNADAVAKHFYEQGKADAMKDSVAKAKNVNMNPRQAHGTIEAGGVKVRVLGDNSSDFKFKINKNK
jgi:hypothetical protein